MRPAPARPMRRAAMVSLGAAALSACSEMARLPESSGFGPRPTLPEPVRGTLPTVNIAPAVGWTDVGQPTVSEGLRVTAFARELDHPRWLHVLPNGDVLVAESNAPVRPGRKGLRNWIMGKVMKRAGAGSPSANRLTLLRDRDGDG
ncbi:MAG TPA: sorbosone dehydrogenase family protein, partial [Burkholderiaceae bacterium]|nr:sorbosone dehydrogenase family protein [Burkholderiaceae bacterium]